MSPSRRGAVIYCNPNASRSARRLRARGMVLGVTFIVMGILFFLGDGEPREVLIIFGSIVLVIGVIVLAEGNSVRDFRIHEKGIRLAGHGLPDVLRNPFIRFDSISRIVVHGRDRYMTVIHKDAKDKSKSDDIWRSDVEGDFSEVTGILKDRAEMEMA